MSSITQNKFLVSWKASLLCLFIGMILLSSGCDKSGRIFKTSLDVSAQQPLLMVIKDQTDEHSLEVSEQVLRALDYTKIPFFTVDFGIISQNFNIPQSVRTIVVTNESIQRLKPNNIEDLVEFVTRGNSVIFTSPVAYDNVTYLQGIKANSSHTVDQINKGIYFYEDVFPGMKNQKYLISGAMIHNGLLASEFSKDIQILAGTATDHKVPFLISNKIGLGEVLTINSYAVFEKMYRGLIFSTVLRTLEGVPYQVADVGTIFLDDFPAPLYNKKLPPIDREYDVTQADFVSKIWWPDMKALADTFNISYSVMTAFNYNANVVPPFDFREWNQGTITINQKTKPVSIFLAHDVRDSRHELAFHGYNHFSLWKKDWDNIHFMISSLQAARKQWSVDNLGPLPASYVPPTNEIDSLGMEAIIRGMPSIKTMNSLYLGDVEDGGGREFSRDPYVPSHIFDYPRITSGYTTNSNSLFDQNGMQLLTGIWTHFVHPDDVFQVVQREEDAFKSRNPLGLGWKSDPKHSYGLYHLFKKRLTYTKKYYPNIQFVTAAKGAARAEDWRRSLTKYSINQASIKIETGFRGNYQPHITDGLTSWFMYVNTKQVAETEDLLDAQNISYARSPYWEGYLYQLETKMDRWVAPNFDKSYYYDPQFVLNLIRDKMKKYDRYTLEEEDFELNQSEDWKDTRLEDAVKAWKKNPKNVGLQEQLITLSVEYNQVPRAIRILESRLLNNPIWLQMDSNRLIKYYGWEGMQTQAELFLEKLWHTYMNAQVITFKNQVVAALGLFGQGFDQRWRKLKLELAPNDYLALLEYTKSIETQENWPKMKQNLRQLLEIRPQTDSLYAFTLQRSLYYDSPAQTLALLESFPITAYSQLTPFASNLAQLYGFETKEYEKALFWADNAPNFDERNKLYWIAQLKLDALYKATAEQLILEHPEDDSLRAFIGTNLFYEGYTDDAYRILYPLFEKRNSKGFAADTLVTQEVGYLSYAQKKEFYKTYPAFFNEKQLQVLKDNFRRQEGGKITAFGQFSNDNFRNTFARGGLSVQFGNRQKNSHTVKTEYLIFSDEALQASGALNYQGAGYEFAHRSPDQQLEFKAGPTVLFGNNDVISEGLISLSYSKDSTFTSVQAKGGSELTSTSLQNDYYRGELQLYRQDFWFDGNVSTAFSLNGKYYTNKVFSYGGQGRIYLDAMDSKWKIKPLAELAYSDATRSFTNGIPFYTPDQYFSQGAGIEMQFRNPDTFDYVTRFKGQVKFYGESSILVSKKRV